MPYNTEYMEPTVAERQLREAAKHLVYLSNAMGLNIHESTRAAAADIYGGQDGLGDRRVAHLCRTLQNMSEEELSKHVYDGRKPQARRLADWWDEHQREDWKRREAEAKEAKSFDTCLELAKQYGKGGYSNHDISAKIAEITGAYFDSEYSAHYFAFEDGVIILSAMDGIVAYKGKRVE